MGNCASNPKTNESNAPVPEPVAEEVKVEETKPEETADEKSLGTLLNEVLQFYYYYFGFTSHDSLPLTLDSCSFYS